MKPHEALNECARDQHRCATCNVSPLLEVSEGGDGKHCGSCERYWKDCDEGLFETDDWSWA